MSSEVQVEKEATNENLAEIDDQKQNTESLVAVHKDDDIPEELLQEKDFVDFPDTVVASS